MMLSANHCTLLIDLIDGHLKTDTLPKDLASQLKQCQEELKRENGYHKEKQWCQEKLPFTRRCERNLQS